jgi:hypothetical protein
MLDALLKYSPMVEALAGVATVCLAVVALLAWRRQVIGQRKIQVAESTLLATYKVRDAMAYIRNSGAFLGASSRKRQPGESDSLSRLKDSYFVPLERMQNASADFAEFEKMQLLCQVYFDAKSGVPFERIKKARQSVWAAATALLTTAGDDVERPLTEKWRGYIWEGMVDAAADELTQAVTTAVAEIEALCRPHLKR